MEPFSWRAVWRDHDGNEVDRFDGPEKVVREKAAQWKAEKPDTSVELWGRRWAPREEAKQTGRDDKYELIDTL
jgi:hypothetical protein